ncbi:hypothetical protein FHW02_003763 [Ochrobactrum sp. RH1CCR137]|nr:hypothetical protein [Ochrobactrum sp. RH1CCR137]MBA8857403.1 hypothetical protein [Ochrobactrum sp. RH1CCR134]
MTPPKAEHELWPRLVQTVTDLFKEESATVPKKINVLVKKLLTHPELSRKPLFYNS